MDTVYSALVRWGPEWDGQSIYYTYSKALFEQMKVADRREGLNFDSFSEELKAELRAKREAFTEQDPDIAFEEEEDMSINEAMEWLEVICPKFPIILAGETELNCSWNW
jgi:hypothetical protein